MMPCILVIDFSVVCYKQWSRKSGSNYEAEFDNELSEFTMNMYIYILYLVTRFKPTELIFAMDHRPPWRTKVFEDWYIKNSELFQKTRYIETTGESEPEQEYIAQFDQKTVRYWFHSPSQTWMMKTMIKAHIDKINWDDYILIPVEEKRDILYGKLKEHAPRYKKRDNPWDYDTPKYGYTNEDGSFVPGFIDISNELAEKLAGTFDGIVIGAKGAEADDVIAHYVKRDKSGQDIVVVSTDQDLYQLYLDNMFFKYFNPNIDEEGHPSQWGGFINLTTEFVTFELRKKLLMGDISDTIAGCSFYTMKKKEKVLKTNCVGKKTAIGWLTDPELKLKDIVKMLEPKSFARNRLLIHLDNIPFKINKKIANAFKKAKIPFHVLDDYYQCPNIKKLSCKNYALSHRKNVQAA